MCRSRTRKKTLWVGFALAVALMSVASLSGFAAQTSPEGFCQSYLLLGELSQPNGAGPSLANKRLDYLADGLGLTEATLVPEEGMVINVDFGGAAASTGFQPGIPNHPVPTIFAPPIPGDTADFTTIYGALDQLMTYAWTYVVNGTGGPLNTYLGVAADDESLIVLNGVEVGETTGWHNNRLVDVTFPVTLPAGKSLLMIKVFEGGGGHNLRVRFQPNDITGDVSGTPGEANVTYSLDPRNFDVMAEASRTLPATGVYGPGAVIPVTVTVYRQVGNPSPVVTETLPAGWTASNIAVSQGTAPTPGGTLTWDLGQMTADTATMTYDATAAGAGVATFSGNITVLTGTHGSVSLPITGDSQLSDTEITQTDLGFAREFVFLGHYMQPTEAGDNPGVPALQQDYLQGGGITEASFATALPTPGVVINTDYTVAESTALNTGNVGFSAPTPFVHVEQDERVDFSGGNSDLFGDRNDCMTYVWCIARNKGAARSDLYVGVDRDDSILVAVNGVEVGRISDGQGLGGANNVEEAWGPVTLNAGDNIIMLKVFEGGGGHGFRLRLQTDSTTNTAATAANTVPPDQVELLVADKIALGDRDISPVDLGIVKGATDWGIPVYQPGVPLLVTVTVNRAKAAPEATLVETLPAGWTVNPVTTATLGTVTLGPGTVTWNLGVMITDTETLTYEVTPDLAAAGDAVILGSIAVVGSGSFPVKGDQLLLGLVPGLLGTAPGTLGIFDLHRDIGDEHVSVPPGDPPAPPAGTSIPGSATEAGGVYTISGSGADFWGNWDRGYLVAKVMRGGFYLEADVAWTDVGPNDWAKTGVMVRNRLDSGSPNATELIRNPEAGGSDVRNQWRDTQNGGSAGTGLRGFNITGGPLPTPYNPVRLRIARMGNSTGGAYHDGTQWVADNTHIVPELNSDADVLACLFVTSHQDDWDNATQPGAYLNTAVFSNVVINPLVVGKAERSFNPTQYTVGQPVRVTIDVTHQANVNPLVITETLPVGWGADNISHGGTVAVNVITWTLDFQADVQLTYDAWPPGGVGDRATFSGILTEPTVGDLPIGGAQVIFRVESDMPNLLVAWWPLDEGSGDTIGDVLGNYDGTRMGQTQWLVPGAFGNAVILSGNGNGTAGGPPNNDDYLDFPDPGPPTYLNSRRGTMMCWFLTDTTLWQGDVSGAAEGTIIYGTESGGDGYGGNAEIHINMDDEGNYGRLQFFMEGNNIGGTFDTTLNTPNDPAPRYADSQWHHVAGTWDIDTGVMRLYVDGVQIVEGNHPGISFDCTDEIRIGRPNNDTRYFGGFVDDARIYNYALSAQEIADIYITPPDPLGVAPPADPSNLRGDVFAGRFANLQWTDNATNEAGFLVARRLGTSGTWRDVAQLGRNTVSFIDQGVTPGNTYTYRVRAFNEYGESGNSNELTLFIEGPPLDAKRWSLYR